MTKQANKQMLARDPTGDTNAGSVREYPGTPRWVKVFGIVIIALAVLVLVIVLIGGHTSPIQHGP